MSKSPEPLDMDAIYRKLPSVSDRKGLSKAAEKIPPCKKCGFKPVYFPATDQLALCPCMIAEPVSALRKLHGVDIVEASVICRHEIGCTGKPVVKPSILR